MKIVVNVYDKKHRRRMSLTTFGPVAEQVISQGPEAVPMIAVLTDSQQASVTYASPKNRKGNPAPIQAGSLAWKTSDASVASVTPGTENPIVGKIVAAAAGVCEIWPEADADLGDGVVTIAGEHVGVQVTAGPASAIGAPVLGTIEEQP